MVFSHLSPLRIEIKAIAADHDLILVRDVGGDSGDEFQIIHRLFLGAFPGILIPELACSLVEEKPF